ncbi:hypothetical protein [Prevotella aurantiaca]|uniref:hypothetical protein n=1 Tax=Prevotella aurantiaca TaxID=596085 RepID=UPI0028E90595|nr:hypothetical protein [Prevotella aurantiaca]
MFAPVSGSGHRFFLISIVQTSNLSQSRMHNDNLVSASSERHNAPSKEGRTSSKRSSLSMRDIQL